MKEDIRPLKGPAELWDWWSFLGWLLLTLLLALLIVFIIRVIQMRMRGEGEKNDSSGPPPLPYELALEALSHLDNSDLLKKREYRLFYIELSEILRKYLGSRFEVNTLDQTTWEIDQLLKRIGISSLITDTARDILEEADLVKFAKYVPSFEVPLETLERTRRLIKETIPLTDKILNTT